MNYLQSLNEYLDKLRKTSGYQMCPGIKDFDEILEDVRMQPATVKEELCPWRLVGAKSCKLWHKPRDCFMQRDEAERELDGVCSNCKQVRRKLKIVQGKRKDQVLCVHALRERGSLPPGSWEHNLTCNTKLIKDCIYNNTDYPVWLFSRWLAKLLLLVIKKYLCIIRLYMGKDMLPKRYKN